MPLMPLIRPRPSLPSLDLPERQHDPAGGTDDQLERIVIEAGVSRQGQQDLDGVPEVAARGLAALEPAAIGPPAPLIVWRAQILAAALAGTTAVAVPPLLLDGWPQGFRHSPKIIGHRAKNMPSGRSVNRGRAVGAVAFINMTDAIDSAAHFLRDGRHVAVLTGAGISAESDIPTFREAQTGLWARYRVEDLATPEAFARDPALVWNWYRWRRRLVAAARSNAGHRALVDLERRVERVTVVTQNVDGLHQEAGSREVWELHGSLRRVICSRERTVVAEDADEAGEEDKTVVEPPRCERCGAYLRPDVVWFGEMLPADALEAGFEAAAACDVLLSVGTSNLVYPAASIPWIAADRGIPVIVVNPDPTGQRTGANVHHLSGRAAAVLPALVREAFER